MSWLRYCTDVAHCRSTRLCTVFGCLLGWYTMYTFLGGMLPCNGIFPRAKFTLRPSFAFSYIGSITAWHSSSGRWPNFAAFSRGRHLYSAERPSRWSSAHILVCVWNISGTAEQICTKFTRKTCLVPRSDEFEGQGQRSRFQGLKTVFFVPFSGLCAVCLVKPL